MCLTPDAGKIFSEKSILKLKGGGGYPIVAIKRIPLIKFCLRKDPSSLLKTIDFFQGRVDCAHAYQISQNVLCKVSMIFSGIFSALLITGQQIQTNDHLVPDILTFYPKTMLNF